MFNFKNKDEIVPSTMILLAILTLAATLAYMVFVPAPNAKGVAKGRTRSRQQLEAEIAKAKAKSRDAKAAVSNRLWSGNSDAVMAQVLAQLTTQANRYQLKVAAFRPQRQRSLANLTELPCNVQVSGPYPTVVAFLNRLDNRDTRIAIRSAQISAADGSSSTVTATLGLSVYFVDTVADSTKTGGSNG